jgi:ADP-ribosylglycohydrolase
MSKAMSQVVPASNEVMSATFGDRVAGALWGMHIADALAMPTHWFYGGERQVKQIHGGFLSGYGKPPMAYPGSIMNLSNTGGAGRGGDDGDIVGSVICHGKKKYWTRGQDFHYHCTLQPGENTLECDITRECYNSITANKGSFSSPLLQDSYIKFMTTPGTHNDCYAGTCHRMFFHNRERGIPLAECPDNDNHNVDTQDGLTMTIPVALATATQPKNTADATISECVAVVRRSSAVKKYASTYSQMLRDLLEDKPLAETLKAVGGSGLERSVNSADSVVA